MYETLNLSEEDKKDISQIIAALQTFAKGVINETTERHVHENRKKDKFSMIF